MNKNNIQAYAIVALATLCFILVIFSITTGIQYEAELHKDSVYIKSIKDKVKDRDTQIDNLKDSIEVLQKKDTVILNNIKVIYRDKTITEKVIEANSCKEDLSLLKQYIKEYEENNL
jgi:hypothetical protein